MIAWGKKYKCSITISALLIVCTFLGYSWVNALVTVDHAWKEAEWRGKKIEVLKDLLQETGKHTTRRDLLQFINMRFKDKSKHLVKEDKDSITVDDVIIKFNGESFSGVKFINEE